MEEAHNSEKNVMLGEGQNAMHNGAFMELY
jgi:hypothetical protein